MKILLVGGHENLNFLTKSLKANGHDVTVINKDYQFCEMISDTYEVVCVNGDGTNASMLEKAGALNMDIVIALCNKDASNLIICETAKKKFNVKNTITVVNDPKNIKLFEDLGVDRCICTAQTLTEIIQNESIIENLQGYMPMENGKVLICEIELDEKSPVLNKKLWEIGFPKESTASCIVRAEKIIIPQGNTELKNGDKVIVLSAPEAIEKINLLLSGSK
jgi:trk system potassium uptake protein TrkA